MGNSNSTPQYLRKRILYDFPKLISDKSTSLPNDNKESKEEKKDDKNENISNVPSIGRKAVVVGATGATGKYIVYHLIKSNQWSKVKIIHRRKLDLDKLASEIGSITSEEKGKVVQNVIDMKKIKEHSKLFSGYDVTFCTLGTVTGGKTAEAFREVDLYMVRDAAKAARGGGVLQFNLLTSQGANSNIWANDWSISKGLLYLKVKGQSEDEVISFKFPRTSIFRPGFLERPGTTRTKEKLASIVMTGTHVSDLAKVMVFDAESDNIDSNKVDKPLFYEKKIIDKIAKFEYYDKNITLTDYKLYQGNKNKEISQDEIKQETNNEQVKTEQKQEVKEEKKENVQQNKETNNENNENNNQNTQNSETNENNENTQNTETTETVEETQETQETVEENNNENTQNNEINENTQNNEKIEETQEKQETEKTETVTENENNSEQQNSQNEES